MCVLLVKKFLRREPRHVIKMTSQMGGQKVKCDPMGRERTEAFSFWQQRQLCHAATLLCVLVVMVMCMRSTCMYMGTHMVGLIN